MISYSEKAWSFVSGLTLEQFQADERTQLAVVRCIEIVGEAVKSIPEDVRQLAPNIPWRQIAKTRDIVVHHYFGVQLDIIWQVTQKQSGAAG